jgi:FtsH-binding integral membrane protein
MVHVQGIILTAAIALALNLPFGYMRKFTRKFSLWWMVCIHLPVVFVALIRIETHTPYIYIPLFLTTSILGQILGSRLPACCTAENKEEE